MRSADGQDIWCRGIYREVVEPERIVSTDSFSDTDGNVVAPSKYEGCQVGWSESLDRLAGYLKEA